MLRAIAVSTLVSASPALGFSAVRGVGRGGFLGRSAAPARSEGASRKVSATAPRMDLFNELFGAIKERTDPPLISPDQALPGEAPTPHALTGRTLTPPLSLSHSATPGRPQKMSGIEGTRHFVLGNDLEKVPEGFKVAVFANGCFWGSEKGIWRLPGDGIYSTAVGYCAGYSPNPTYEEACSGRTGHTEGVRVVGRTVCGGRTVYRCVDRRTFVESCYVHDGRHH